MEELAELKSLGLMRLPDSRGVISADWMKGKMAKINQIFLQRSENGLPNSAKMWNDLVEKEYKRKKDELRLNLLWARPHEWLPDDTPEAEAKLKMETETANIEKWKEQATFTKEQYNEISNRGLFG